MQKHSLKFGKVFTSVACTPLILISNNSELAAKYLPNDVDQSIKTLEIPNLNNDFFKGIDIKQEKKFLLAENNNDNNEESVLISEIIIEGWENHPEGRKLELAAYDSMSIKPGSIVDNQILNKDLNAIYAGIPGTVGLLGSEANSSFVVLAQTNLTITEYTESLVAGEFLQVNGTLFDDLGQPLLDGDVPSASVIHLLVDGESVSSVETDSQTGSFSIGYTVPEDIGAGAHIVEVRFYGGRNWVDPIGEGEPSNPEYYMPSSDSVQFNISVPTVLTLLTQTGDVNREDVMTIEGTLVDIVANPLAGLTIEVYLDGEFMTNVTTDATGLFTAIYPVPADAELGPVLLEVKFNGTNFYLESDANSTWNIFSHYF